MTSLTPVFSILFTFWPALFLFGLRKIFLCQQSWSVCLRQATNRIFVGWLVWLYFYIVLNKSGVTPFVFIPQPLNDALFFATGLFTGSITLIDLFVRIRKNHIRLQDGQTIEALLALDPDQFEHLIAELFESYGHQVTIPGGNGDHGIDVLVTTSSGEKWIVQCKRYSGSVGEPVVRDLYGTLLHADAQQAYLMTTGSITRAAAEWAEGKPIILYDGENLVRLIRRTQRARINQQL